MKSWKAPVTGQLDIATIERQERELVERIHAEYAAIASRHALDVRSRLDGFSERMFRFGY